MSNEPTTESPGLISDQMMPRPNVGSFCRVVMFRFRLMSEYVGVSESRQSKTTINMHRLWLTIVQIIVDIMRCIVLPIQRMIYTSF